MTSASPPPRFAVLRSWKTAPYLVGAGLAMMGDNIEHVITYFVLWQTFHSPVLVGFQLVSHWLPFLLFSVYAGGLAERYDCRRIIQIGMGLFILVSICWGVLFLTGSLQLWQACVLLVLHGIAGCLWSPAEQFMLYDFAGREQLTSAVRINATFHSLGILCGPVVGSALILWLGSDWGIIANIVFYLPIVIFLFVTRFTGHTRDTRISGERVTFLAAFKVLGTIRRHRVLLGMIALAALASVSIGAVLQTAMPAFEHRFAGSDLDGELIYGLLLFALGMGGVVGGFALEATGLIKPDARTAVISSVLFGGFAILFASSTSLSLALVALVCTGVAQITSSSTAQAIVQLEAPPAERGRVLGAYSMFGPGMQTFSGLVVGVLGSFFSIPTTVVVCGAVLVIGALATGWYIRGRR